MIYAHLHPLQTDALPRYSPQTKMHQVPGDVLPKLYPRPGALVGALGP